MRKDGKLHLSKPITLSNYKPVVKSNIHISRCEVLHLGDNLCVGESVLCCFARDFNAREFSKREKDPDYIPCHMFDTYIMEKIKRETMMISTNSLKENLKRIKAPMNH